MSPVHHTLRRRAGFSLVEVSLAILVVAIGLLSVFSLFPASLDFAKKSVDETHIAFFGEEVLNQLQAFVRGSRDAPDVVLKDIEDGIIYMDIPAPDRWYGADSLKITADGLGKINTIVFRQVDDQELVSHALRYSLAISQPSPRRLGALLRVWNGEYGTTNLEDAVDFYTEFFYTGVRK